MPAEMYGGRYPDRREAGRALAAELGRFTGREDVLVLALPRGGVPVGEEVARALGAPLDLFLVRKLGVPGHEELAMGALASGGVLVVNESVTRALGIDEAQIERAVEREAEELRRRELAYRGESPPPEVAGRTVILVDDGLATGSTMRAAAAAVRKMEPRRLVIAVPVAAAETCAELSGDADELVCPYTPEPFQAVGLWYADFAQTTDREVREILARVAGGGATERKEEG